MPTREIQGELTIDDDLSPYKGSWVAIRDGKVVAAALDPIELRDREDVRESDWFILVPDAIDGAYLL